MKENSYVFNVLCHLIFTVILHVYFYMSITVFSMYYIFMFSDNKNIICYQNVIKNFQKPDFNYFCDIYNEISDLVKLFEKQVGIPVFISFHVYVLVMFLMISGKVYWKENTLRCFAISVFFTTTALNFFVQMLYAMYMMHHYQ